MNKFQEVSRTDFKNEHRIETQKSKTLELESDGNLKP